MKTGSWEGLPEGEGWTRSAQLVLFQFDSYPDGIDSRLWIVPGPGEVRRLLIDLPAERQPPYRLPKRRTGVTRVFKSIFFSRHFLRADGEIEPRITAQWDEFVARDLPALVAPLQEAARSTATSLPMVRRPAEPHPCWRTRRLVGVR